MDEVRILLIEDDEEDYIIFKDILSGIEHHDYSIEWVSSYEKAVQAVNGGNAFDVLVVDQNLGGKTGLDLIGETQERTRRMPVIMMTGQTDREVDLLSMRMGVSDFLVKGKFDAEMLERSIRYAMEKKKAENQILYLAYYDQLTELPNRVFFKEQLNYALAHAIRYSRSLAVLYLDLDNFKLVNDSLGHHVGDLLLKEAARRLCACVRRSDIIARNHMQTQIDTVARLGGDEFTVSLTEIGSAEDASIVASRFIASFNQPFLLEGNEIWSGVSIGIALFPTDAEDTEGLMKFADNAMYHAKKQGKNTYQYYQKSMHENVVRKMETVRNIRRAVEKSEFLLHYQPVMSLAESPRGAIARGGNADAREEVPRYAPPRSQAFHIIGFEALIRWRHDGGIIHPLDFIPFAEQHNLISFITDWVIHEVCRQLKVWSGDCPPVPISINLPITQFKKTDFAGELAAVLAAHGLDAALFALEVTESIFSEDTALINPLLQRLADMGVGIAIDDFGMGFSSLSRLKEIRCDTLKIDKSFVGSIGKDAQDSVIISSIIAMGHGLNMQVVAEGVETREQLRFLAAHECDAIQGYILSPPVPPEKALDMLQKQEAGQGNGIELRKGIEQ